MSAVIAGETLQTFVARLLEEKNLQNVDAEILSQLKADLSDRVEDRVNAAILNALPEEALDPFEKLLETGGDEDLQEFCRKHIPNIQDLVAAELLAFRKTYLDLAE